jgi:hypothetical protein
MSLPFYVIMKMRQTGNCECCLISDYCLLSTGLLLFVSGPLNIMFSVGG